MRAQFPSGGGIALLFPATDACRFATVLSGDGVERSSLEECDMAALKELGASLIGSGYSALMGTLELELGEAGDVSAAIGDPDLAEEIARFVGEPLRTFLIEYKDSSDGEGKLAVLYSQRLEGLVPGKLTGAEAAPILSDAEVSDILSGFDTGAVEVEGPAAPADKQHARPPANLDMILDIRLVATARLGRVEMPIGEILALGPGSIIDVGHMVDEPVELLVNNKLIARGDVVVVDEKFGLRITEIVSTKARIESMR
jgi:flagellar motor switch protein FliN